MDYLSYIKTTFKLDGNNGSHVFCYLEDQGDITTFDFNLPDNKTYDQYGKEELDYYVCNYLNRQGGNLNTLDLICFSVGSYEDLYVTFTNKVDFVLFSCSNQTFNVTGGYVNAEESSPNYDDIYGLENYSYVTSNGVFNYSSTNKGEYYKELSNQDITIFDYTSLTYENGSYTQDVNFIRGENVSLYNAYFHIGDANGDNVYIGYGAPYHDIANSEYQRGYGNGSASGYVNGYDAGYKTGVNTQPIEVQEATAFSYIGNAFGAVNSILSLEILPNVTLGLCFSIPLVFVLIMTIFKLVRK